MRRYRGSLLRRQKYITCVIVVSCVILSALILSGVMVAMMPAGAWAAEPDKKFNWYGDFRFRLERDWNSQDAAGKPRDDRDRARIRARLGVNFQPNENFLFGFRLRTGSEDSHQSPHLTIFEKNKKDLGGADVTFDKRKRKGTVLFSPSLLAFL